MARGRPKATLVLSEEERAQLASFARSRSLPSALSNRAKIIMSSADGEANSAIASRLQINPGTVRKWRTQFIERRINGLYSETRIGKPRSIDDERLAGLINTTLHTKPANGSTHWSVRAVAEETGISKTSVHRYFKMFGLQPHRSEHFKLSTDAFFIEKLRDVVGLYLSPPDNALVLCVDEKSQWCCARRVQAPPSSPGVPGVSAHHRQVSACPAGHSLHRGQLRHSFPSEGARLARRKATLEHALHPDLQLVAQSGRALLRSDHGQDDSSRLVLFSQGLGQQDRSLRRLLQPDLQALRLDRHRRLDPREAPSALLAYQRDSTLAPESGRFGD